MEPTYLLAKAVVKPWLRAWVTLHIEGLDNIPTRGPAILAVNHIAYLDPLVVAYAIDSIGRRARFLAKSELFADRRIGWILRGAGQIEVRRGTRDAPMALDQAVAALERGEIVVVFPEGTVTTDPQLNPRPAKSGLARLALKTRAPLIPGAVWGTANIWPKGYQKRWWPPRQDVLVRFGEPLEVSGDSQSPSDWRRVGQEVMEAVEVLLASLRLAVPDRRRPRDSAA